MELALATLLAASGPEVERHVDTLKFEIRQDTATLALLAQAEQMVGEHLGPARGVRDAVQGLYEQMSAWILHATGLLDAAGRRVRALGAAADAPAVVADLQGALRDLHEAMYAAEDRLAASRAAVARALPDLLARSAAQAEVRALTGGDP
jgi:predicted component of type VI protein secretion system